MWRGFLFTKAEASERMIIIDWNRPHLWKSDSLMIVKKEKARENICHYLALLWIKWLSLNTSRIKQKIKHSSYVLVWTILQSNWIAPVESWRKHHIIKNMPVSVEEMKEFKKNHIILK